MKTTANPVAVLNDRFRARPHDPLGCLMFTRAVSALEPVQQFELLLAVKRFDAFTPDNDPYGEHDFGSLDLFGRRWFWKIDCYADRTFEAGSEDAADPARSYRVLTLMEASEY